MILDSKLETRYHFVIADMKTEAYLGQIDIIKIDWKNRIAEMGIVIGNNNLLGKGLETEAIKLLQGFVFGSLNLNRLQLSLRDYNERAYKCYIKCGFVEEGRFKQNFYINGQYTDTIYMAILRDNYLKLTRN
jgi:RimJ/RimL family protein N-acetyltransferase